MTKNKPIPFAELRQLLHGLGYTEKRTDRADIFHHPSEGLLVFRVYRDEEPVAQGDLVSTRTFLDLRGLLEATAFDLFLERAATTA